MSTDESGQPVGPARRGPMALGLALVGIGATAALAAQTGLSFSQAGSICLLLTAVMLLLFLVARAQGTQSPSVRP